MLIIAKHTLPTELKSEAVHTKFGVAISRTKSLQVVQYDGDAGYYLIRYSESGTELTDTYHGTLESAFDQAKFEYCIDSTEWSGIRS